MGLGITVIGVATLLIGAWVSAVGSLSIGLCLTLMGAFLGGAGLCLALAPDEQDAGDAEFWARWADRWQPQCPVHGEELCYTRTDRCPGVRDRVP